MQHAAGESPQHWSRERHRNTGALDVVLPVHGNPETNGARR